MNKNIFSKDQNLAKKNNFKNLLNMYIMIVKKPTKQQKQETN